MSDYKIVKEFTLRAHVLKANTMNSTKKIKYTSRHIKSFVLVQPPSDRNTLEKIIPDLQTASWKNAAVHRQHSTTFPTKAK